MRIVVRNARPDDAEALVRIHADASAYYAALDPALFQAPPLDGEVIAALYARLLTPPEGAEYAYPRDVAVTRLEIAYLATASEHRRTGAGLALVEAAETWGREHGATVAEASTYHDSPLSVPFWTRRAGYAPRSIVLRKEL
jgi:GNAT superfamily N-acetyltransferase